MRLVSILAAMLVMVMAISTMAAGPGDITYQGILLAPDKTPVVDQFFDVLFSVYSDSIGGTELWSQLKQVETENGQFSAVLQNPFGFLSAEGSTPPDDTYFLQIQVGADPPLAPRTRFMASYGSIVSRRVNGDILTRAGNILIQPPNVVPPDPVQPSIEMSADTGDVQLIMTNVRPNGDQIKQLFGSVYGPGDAHYGAITFSRTPSGQDPDTSFTLLDKADVTVEKFQHKQEFGPTQQTRQGVNNNSGFSEALSFDGADSSHAIIQAELNRATLKTYFETGDIPTQAQFSSSADSASVDLFQEAADGTASATLSTSADNPGTADEKGRAAMALSVLTQANNGRPNAIMCATGAGGYVILADSLGDTSIVIEGEKRDPSDPGGGAGGRVIVRRLDDDFDIGLNTKELVATADLLQMSAESQSGAGSGGMVQISLGSIEMIDSIGDTTIQTTSLGTIVGTKIKKESSACESKAAAERAFDSVIKHDPADSTKQKKVEIGATLLTAYMSMLDSIGDTTVIVQSDRAGGGGGRVLVRGGAAVDGFADEVELADVDGDGIADITVDGSIAIGETPPLEKLTVIGNICATGTIGPCSDARYKKDVATIDDALKLIEPLRGVNFKYKTDEYPQKEFSSEKQIGFIAQEVVEVLPSIVSQGKDGYYSVDYSRLTPLLVEAVKTQQTEIDELRTQLEELKTLVIQLADNKSSGGNIKLGMN